MKSRYSLLRHICVGVLLNHDPRNAWVASLNYSAYVDDGGHPADRPAVIASGFLATEENWLRFEPKWRDVVKRCHLKDDVFHMADFEQKFAGKPEKWDILNELITIIRDHAEATLIAMVDMTDYKSVNREYPLEECIGKPFAIAARCVARNINLWKKNFFHANRDKLLVFVEDGTLHRGDMEEVFKRDALPIPTPVPKSTPAVQPADMLSWEVGHFYENNSRRRTLRRILSESKDLIEGRYGKKHMLEGLKMMGIPKRGEIPANVGFVFHSSKKRVRRRTVK